MNCDHLFADEEMAQKDMLSIMEASSGIGTGAPYCKLSDASLTLIVVGKITSYLEEEPM